MEVVEGLIDLGWYKGIRDRDIYKINKIRERQNLDQFYSALVKTHEQY